MPEAATIAIKNVGGIIGIAIIYYYLVASFGPFKISAATDFSFSQLKIFAGIALVVTLSTFYGPIRGIICVFLGEGLVQLKLGTPPAWGFLLVYACFLVPLFFIHINGDVTHVRRNAFQFGEISLLGVATSCCGFIIVGFASNVPIAILFTQLLAYLLSSLTSFFPLVLVLGLVFIWVRQPRTIYSVFFAHHIWEDRDHTIRVSFGGLVVHLCTRCTGMVTGVIAIAIVMDLTNFSLDPWVAFTLCAILPAPNLFIWSGQKLGFWKDVTPSRIVNGALVGVAIFLISQTREVFGAMVILLIVYFSIFFGIFILGPFYLHKKQIISELEEDEANSRC